MSIVNDFQQWHRSVPVHNSWDAWQASHTLYAPRWLPIDEAAKGGRWVDVWHPSLGRMPDCTWCPAGYFYQAYSGIKVFGATHYMPIPDAPEKA